MKSSSRSALAAEIAPPAERKAHWLQEKLHHLQEYISWETFPTPDGHFPVHTEQKWAKLL
jgi:hypothetical protein